MRKIYYLLMVLITQGIYGQISFTEHAIDSTFQRSSYSWAVDLDNDRDMDIVATAYYDNEIAWFENDGEQNFTKHTITNTYNGAYYFEILDIDGDNDYDIFSKSYDNVQQLYVDDVFINDGTQNFTLHSLEELLGTTNASRFNFDGNSLIDFVEIDYATNQVTWYQNNGGLNFTEHTTPIDLSDKVHYYSIDLDLDADIDIVAVDTLTYTNFSWLENDSGNSFIEHSMNFDTGGEYLYEGKHKDIDKDGDLDLLLYSQTNNQIYLYENDGTQNFTKRTIDTAITTPFTVSSEDLDGDGDNDIVATGYNDDKTFWYENDGTLTFTKRQVNELTNGPLGHFLTDVDNDGDKDIIVNGYLDHTLLWFENSLTSQQVGDHVYQAPVLGNYNYIYTIAPQKAMTTLDSVKINSDAIENVSYFDGLGRPLQQVAIRNGGNGEDNITPIVYDDYGRQALDYLPYAESTNTGVKYREGVELLIPGFYNEKYPEDFTGLSENEFNPYSEKHFEASPLNRVLEQGAPGASWKVDHDYDTDHTIKFEYQTNGSDEVRLFEVIFSDPQDTEAPSLSENGYYLPGKLYKTITKDENWTSGTNHTTEEFKDIQGRVVLKRTYADIQGISTPHDTYYVYDDYGNLTYVIPPEASDENPVTSTLLDELGYQYKYDYRNRLIEKKIPGKEIEYIVYDNLDRPVLTQDANQRLTNEWLFSKYDALGRVVYTGKYTDTSNDRVDLQAIFTAKQGAAANYEERGSSSLSIGYTNADFPNINLEVLTVNYYDDYTFAGAPFNPSLNPETVFDEQTTINTKGLATGSKVKVLDTTDWITAVTYYDEKARPIYVYTQNDFLSTTDIVSSDLDFTGKVLKTRTSHIRGSNPELVTVDTYTYDQAGRLLKQVQCIGDSSLSDDCGASGAEGLEATLLTSESVNPGVSETIEASTAVILQPGFTASPLAGQTVEININQNAVSGTSERELIAQNSYDDLGQLIRKKVGNVESVPLQQVKYAYTIRGWLKQINDVNNTDKLFNFMLQYDGGVNPLYNGNISQSQWRTANIDSSLKTYDYTYDALNRITSAIDNTTNQNYSLTNVTYDRSGNIQSLARNGHTSIDGNGAVTGYGVMDSLTYSYLTNSNKLMKVADVAPVDQFGFKDDAIGTASDSSNDYDYDDNGNMVKDENKSITNINYNHLNLPTTVTINGENISYIYDATGVKLRKTVNGTTTDYTGNYIYTNGDLQFFNTSEGYVTPSGSSFTYVYQYKDHLGNVRLSYTDSDGNGSVTQSEIIEENNYYPFGLKHKGYNDGGNSSLGNNIAQNFKYNGIEFEDALGLNLYEMDFRQYDLAIGRFTGIDIATELDYDITPYRFGYNNPIYWSDPTGLWERTKNGGYQTNDTDEISRLLGYLNQEGSDGSFAGISKYIEEDIAFMKDAEENVPLSTATVVYNRASGKSRMTELSKLKLRNELAYYAGTTNYRYTKEDYQNRNEIFSVGPNPIRTAILRKEREGFFQPLTSSNYIKYIGDERAARMIVFGAFMESMDGPAMELGSIKRVTPRLGSIGTARFKYSASSKVAKFLGLGSRAELPSNIKNMSFREFHSKFSSHYKGRFKGRGTYMTHMSMDWKAMRNGL